MGRKPDNGGREAAAKGQTLARLATGHDLPPRFASLSSSAKLEALLSLPDPGRAIRRLRPDEFYFLLASIGLEDAHDLLLYASPDQRRALCDIESWSGGRYAPERLDRILDLALGVSIDLATSFVRDADVELLALHVLGRCRVELAAESEGGEASFTSPDGVFLLTCENAEDVVPVRRFLDVLYALGVERGQFVLHAAMRATPSVLEDEALRFRDARLQDLGFPSQDERLAIFEPFDVAALRERIARAAPEVPPTPEAAPLALVLDRSGGPPLFWRTLASLPATAAIAFVDRLLYLVNRVLAARSADLHREGAWESAAAHAVAVLSLGLEELAGDDDERAATVLRVAWPVELYRTGVEVLRPIHLTARRIVTDLGGSARLDLLGPEAADTARAALVFPPMTRDAATGARRDLRTLREVRSVRESLRGTAAVVRFAVATLGFRPEASAAPTRSTFAGVFATAWARQVIDGTPSLEPLSGEEVRDLLVAAFRNGRVRPAIRAAATALAGRAPEADRTAVRAFLDKAIDAVEEALGGLDPGVPVDVRFLGDVLLVRR